MEAIIGQMSKLFLLFLLLFIGTAGPSSDWLTGLFTSQQNSFLQETISIFLSILIEALPLILIGVFISSILHVFISDDVIRRVLPKRSIIGIACGSLLGIFFPLCECGIIPIVRRLIQKGVPSYVAVPFMLSAPIINPVVGFSTYLAFAAYPNMAVYRIAGAFICANLIGMVLYMGKSRTIINREPGYEHCDHCHCGHREKNQPNTFGWRLRAMLYHTCDEFFDMGRFLLIGSLIASVIQVTIPRELMLSVGQEPFLSVAGMMAFAFAVSVCSQADAFIAASFINSFTPGAIAAFLIYGPMLDVKNGIMLFHAFKPGFVIKLIIMITCISLILCVMLNYSLLLRR